MERLIRVGANRSTRKDGNAFSCKLRRLRNGAPLELLGYVERPGNVFARREFSCFATLVDCQRKMQTLLPINNTRNSCHPNLTVYMSTNSTEDGFPVHAIENFQELEMPGMKPTHSLEFDLGALREETANFLDEKQYPEGSMNLEAFETARRVLWSWTEVGSLESVEHSIALLEHLVKEQNSNFSPELSELHINQALNYSLLNALVKNWYRCWKEMEAPEERSITPKELLSKIEDWSERSANLSPQTSTISMIMRAIVFHIKSLEEAEYVESLVVRMVDNYQAGNSRLTPSIVEYNVVMNGMAKVRQPERAEAILMRLVDDYENEVSNLKPDPVSFGSVLYAWKHAKTPNAGERAEALLDSMIDFGLRVSDSSISKPNLSCYYAVLYALCGNRTKGKIEQAERFLQRMKQDYKDGNTEARPNDTCYALIIHSWSQLGYGEQSERMLRQMYDDYTRHGNTQAQVTSLHFNSAITAWTRSGAPYAVDRAWELFQGMQTHGIKPDGTTYGALLHCMSRSKNPQVGQAADRLLQEQLERFYAGDEDMKPEALNYNAAMHCWSSVGNAERTEKLLKDLLGHHKQGNLSISDDRPFCTALAAWSRSQSPQRAERAEAIFQEMTKLVQNGVFDFQPSANSYSALQGCWASAERNQSGDRCLALLREMQEQTSTGDSSMQPSESNYKVVIDAFNRIRRPQQAEDLWHEMLKDYVEGKIDAKPGNDTCKAILTGWLQSGAPDAIERTVAMIERLAEIEKSQILDIDLDLNIYHLMLDICSKSRMGEIVAGAETLVRKMEEVHEAGATFVRPDTRCYNIAINCWGKLGKAERAEALFWEMYNNYSKHGMVDAKPDSFTISTVLSAWSRSKSDLAPRRAEVFFERVNKLISSGALDNAKLDVVCYSALLNCLANANTEEAAERADALFCSMQKSAVTGQKGLQPNEKCYFSVIKCLTRAGRIERAEEILFEMAERCTEKRNRGLELRPKRSFGLVIAAWLQSSLDDAPIRAEKLLRWMVQQHKRGVATELPDPLTYASVLRCWARSRRPESGKRVEALLLEMTKSFGPGHKWVQACYSDLVCALARSGNAHRAESLLLRLSRDFVKRKTNTAPDARAFVAVLAGLKSSLNDSSDVPLRTLKLIETMREVDAMTKPRVNVVLDHWNTLPSDSRDRLEVFLSQMEDLDTRVVRNRASEIANEDSKDDNESAAGPVRVAFKL